MWTVRRPQSGARLCVANSKTFASKALRMRKWAPLQSAMALRMTVWQRERQAGLRKALSMLCSGVSSNSAVLMSWACYRNRDARMGMRCETAPPCVAQLHYPSGAERALPKHSELPEACPGAAMSAGLVRALHLSSALRRLAVAGQCSGSVTPRLVQSCVGWFCMKLLRSAVLMYEYAKSAILTMPASDSAVCNS